MAFTPYHNITGSNGIHVELLAPGDNASSIKSITIANTHASNDATVSLSIAKLSDSSALNASETYYLFKTVAIPSDTSLLLDNSDMLSFNNSISGFYLFITVGSSDTVDVSINANVS
tara:strand:+ start:1964 stop:2314 length:351 start_codon:yes stop_codon:yes gene_type:complete